MSRNVMATLNKIVTTGLIGLVTGYRYLISPLIGPRCRFQPTCSNYAIEALQAYGPVKGVVFTILRLLKCHPFHPGGYDPIRRKLRDENHGL